MFQLPEKTHFSRNIPKKKFYEQTGADESLKRLFIQQIESVYWQYKLSKETTHLSPTKDVEEIQIFEITLRERELSEKILKKIDTQIPYPILYVLTYNGHHKLKMAYKEKSQRTAHQQKVISYHESDWQTKESLAEWNILQGIHLQQVYENLIKSLSNVSYNEEETVQQTVQREQKRQKLERQIMKLEKKINRERQFNRKVEMNQELRRLKKELENV